MRKFVALLVALAALPVATAAQAGSGPSSTLQVSAFRVLALTLSGRLVSSKAGTPVGIFARQYGMSTPRRIATVMSSSNGRWSYHAKPSIQTAYFARFASINSRVVTIGVMPAIAMDELSNGHVSVHVDAGRSFRGRQVKLQRLLANGDWLTMTQKPLNRLSAATFALALPNSKVRVAMSVNEAGAGFLGSASPLLSYHAT